MDLSVDVGGAMRLIARGIEFSTLQSDGGKADEAESLVYGVARRSDERELLTRDVEVAGVACVDWFNHRRLHGTITAGPGYTTPAAHGAAYYRETTPAAEPVTQ